MNDGKRPRIALYSHDTQGLGHLRRNLRIATTLANSRLKPDILLITGAREIASFDVPSMTDCLVLPGLGKHSDGHYCARSLSIPLDELIRLRSSTIHSALEIFNPHIFIIDKVPAGAFGELIPSLRMLKLNGQTRCILGLRDVLDDPSVVHEEWVKSDSDLLVRNYFDAIWIYGDRRVYDPVYEYMFDAEIVGKVRYTGYIGVCEEDGREKRVSRHDGDHNAEPGQRSALCLLGGGQDGFQLADNFVRAKLPPGVVGLLVLGPFMPARERAILRMRTMMRKDIRIYDFIVNSEELMKRADLVISMGGYNTVCEILSYKKQALIVPRVVPRTEQLIRAERMSQLGLLDCLHPQFLSPGQLSQWLAQEREQRLEDPGPIDLEGLSRVLDLTTRMLSSEPNAQLAA